MPSDATTIIFYSSVRSNYKISGSPIVPAFIPALSPNERVIANPGIATSFIQTLNGPNT